MQPNPEECVHPIAGEHGRKLELDRLSLADALEVAGRDVSVYRSPDHPAFDETTDVYWPWVFRTPEMQYADKLADEGRLSLADALREATNGPGGGRIIAVWREDGVRIPIEWPRPTESMGEFLDQRDPINIALYGEILAGANAAPRTIHRVLIEAFALSPFIGEIRDAMVTLTPGQAQIDLPHSNRAAVFEIGELVLTAYARYRQGGGVLLDIDDSCVSWSR